jgi:hypothetical protein
MDDKKIKERKDIKELEKTAIYTELVSLFLENKIQNKENAEEKKRKQGYLRQSHRDRQPFASFCFLPRRRTYCP